MKKIVFLLAAFAFQMAVLTVQAQYPWSYSSTDECALDDAYLVEPPDSVKAVLDLKGKSLPYNVIYRFAIPGRKDVIAYTGNTAYKIPLETLQHLMPYLVSDRYWRARMQTLRSWAFVNARLASLFLEVDTSDFRYGRFAPLSWFEYHYQPSTSSPVYFTVRTNTISTQRISLAALDKMAQWGAFATPKDYVGYEEHLRAYNADEEQRREQEIRTLDSLDAIARRSALLADSISAALAADSAALAQEQLRLQVQQTKEHMNRNEIFFMNVNPARSDYMFGLEFNLYNCFKKTITKVEISVTPYNAKGQVQKDKFERSVRSVRCMGPIRPGSPAQYTFDELFWDDSGRIAYLCVTSVTFHFTNGTVRTFSGYNKILKHSLSTPASGSRK